MLVKDTLQRLFDIASWVFAVIITSTPLRRLYTTLWGVAVGNWPFSHKSISVVRYWWQVKVLVVQLAFQLIPKG